MSVHPLASISAATPTFLQLAGGVKSKQVSSLPSGARQLAFGHVSVLLFLSSGLAGSSGGAGFTNISLPPFLLLSLQPAGGDTLDEHPFLPRHQMA